MFGTTLTLWGLPADSSHDGERGSCVGLFFPTGEECPVEPPLKPFLSMPTSCGGPLTTTLHANAWLEPEYHTASFESPAIEGCEKESFNPSLKIDVDPGKADSPAALNVNLHVPQSESAEGLSSALLKKAVVTLPQGVSVNTAAASGLEGCSEAQFGLHANEPAHCPDASKIGTAKIDTPLLEDPLEGSLYQAQQNANPFGSLLAAYLVAEGHGVIIKQAAKFDLNQSTGQITATFDNVPEQPFEDLELSFFGGPRGSVGTAAELRHLPDELLAQPHLRQPADQRHHVLRREPGMLDGRLQPGLRGRDHQPGGWRLRAVRR